MRGWKEDTAKDGKIPRNRGESHAIAGGNSDGNARCPQRLLGGITNNRTNETTSERLKLLRDKEQDWNDHEFQAAINKITIQCMTVDRFPHGE